MLARSKADCPSVGATKGDCNTQDTCAEGATKAETISIVVPCYNAAAQIATCIASLSEPIEFDELIIVDDGSTDRTSEVAAASILSLDRATIFRLEKRRGASAARNHGAEHALSDIVLFIDSDVVVTGLFREALLSHFNESPSVAAVQGIYDSHSPAPSFASQYKNQFFHYYQTRIPSRQQYGASSFFLALRRSALSAVGGFNSNIRRASVEDGELAIDLAAKGFCIRIDKTIKVQHLAEYSFSSMLRRTFGVSAQKMRSLLIKGGHEHLRHYSKSAHPPSKLAGILTAGCSAVGLLFLPLGIPFAVLTGVLALMFFASASGQLRLAYTSRGLEFSLKYCLFLYCDFCAYFCGILFGLFKRSYD